MGWLGSVDYEFADCLGGFGGVSGTCLVRRMGERFRDPRLETREFEMLDAGWLVSVKIGWSM